MSTITIPKSSAFLSTRPIQAVQTTLHTSETMATAIAMLAMADIREKLQSGQKGIRSIAPR